MFLWAIVLAGIRLCIAVEVLNCFCKNNNETFAFSDTALHNVEHKLARLSTSNENLRQHLEVLNKRLENQTDALNELNKKLKSQAGAALETSNSAKTCYTAAPAPLKYPANCAEATTSVHQSGIYAIRIDGLSQEPFLVACDENTQYGGWTVIQRRLDGSVDFYRNWSDYKQGFGNLRGEFFIGMDKLHALTSSSSTGQELLIVMEDFQNVRKYARYSGFNIGNEKEGYPLKKLGVYAGNAGDAMRRHLLRKFSTKDRDNDAWRDGNCAIDRGGAWWYFNCYESNLNGKYLRGHNERGIVWRSFHGSTENLKFVEMMIRPFTLVQALDA